MQPIKLMQPTMRTVDYMGLSYHGPLVNPRNLNDTLG